MKLVKGISVLSAAILLAACGGDDNDNDSSLSVPATYTFESKLISGDSSVSHSGQATRHILISELKKLIGSPELQNVASKDAAMALLYKVYNVGTYTDEVGNLTEFNIYDDSASATPVGISVKSTQGDPEVALELVQTHYTDVSSGKNLQYKLAGVDNGLTHGEFIGWDVAASSFEIPDGTGFETISGENSKPNALLTDWFLQIADLAVDGDPDTKFVTAEGLDLQQLVQKFLLGAVTYSQAAEDYLKADKGLVKQNSAEDKAGKAYTSLEHQWDEGFGYFGAAHDYNLYTDAENKAQQDNDTNLVDGEIDLYSEYSFGHSVNAAKRDKGATVATDFSKGAMDAFLTGRALIQANYGTDPVLGEGYQAELVKLSKVALDNWEKAVAATVVHYINDVITDYSAYGTTSFNAAAEVLLAKHWSEMKGFALGLQFRKGALISVEQLKAVHAAFGEAPALLNTDQAAVDAYVAELEAARAVLQTAYGFNADNVANW